MNMMNLTPVQLRQAADLKEQITNLNQQLAALFGGSATPTPIQPAKPVVAKKGGMSAAGKARIAAAQKLRWAKVNAAKAKPAAVKAAVKAVVAAKPGKMGGMSAAAKANQSAKMKAYWAAKRAATAKPAVVVKPVKKGGMSAVGRANIVAAQKARWAKIKAAKAKPAAKVPQAAKPAAKPARVISAAARAKMAAAAKAMWVRIRAEKAAKKKQSGESDHRQALCSLRVPFLFRSNPHRPIYLVATL